jgi:DNA-binding CsgD family transcriptional regulator
MEMSGAGSSGFSVTERQIALLVAQGRTNREVAEAVGLSPKTVEWHLSNVYRRLRLRSRTELAIRVLERGLTEGVR